MILDMHTGHGIDEAILEESDEKGTSDSVGESSDSNDFALIQIKNMKMQMSMYDKKRSHLKLKA